MEVSFPSQVDNSAFWQDQAPITLLPNELIKRIFAHLPEQITAFRLTCKCFKELTHQDQDFFWQNLLLSHFPHYAPILTVPFSLQYQHRVRIEKNWDQGLCRLIVISTGQNFNKIIVDERHIFHTGREGDQLFVVVRDKFTGEQVNRLEGPRVTWIANSISDFVIEINGGQVVAWIDPDDYEEGYFIYIWSKDTGEMLGNICLPQLHFKAIDSSFVFGTAREDARYQVCKWNFQGERQFSLEFIFQVKIYKEHILGIESPGYFLKVFDKANGELIHTFEDPIETFEIDKATETLYASQRDGLISVYRLHDYKRVFSFDPKISQIVPTHNPHIPRNVYKIVIDQNILFIETFDTLSVVQKETGSLLYFIDFQGQNPRFLFTETYLIVCKKDGIQILDKNNGVFVHILPSHNEYSALPLLVKDHRLFVRVYVPDKVVVWDIEKGMKLWEIEGAHAIHDGDRLISSNRQGVMSIQDFAKS